MRACRSSSAYRMYAITDAQRRTKPGLSTALTSRDPMHEQIGSFLYHATDMQA